MVIFGDKDFEKQLGLDAIMSGVFTRTLIRHYYKKRYQKVCSLLSPVHRKEVIRVCSKVMASKKKKGLLNKTYLAYT